MTTSLLHNSRLFGSLNHCVVHGAVGALAQIDYLLYVLTFCVALAGVASSSGAGTMQVLASDGSNPCDPLHNSHLIVRGTITSVEQKQFTLAQWGLVKPSSRHANIKIPVSMVHLDVDEVLKGKWQRKEVVLAVRDQPSLIQAGAEYIICALWYPPAGGGLFVTEEGLGLYKRVGQGWLKCTSSEVRAPEVLPRKEIDARIHEVDPDKIANEAEIIARGTIAKVWESRYEAHGHAGVLLNVELAVQKHFKGKVTGRTIHFVAPSPGKAYVPDSFRCIPAGIEVGQEWFVFLRTGDLGLFAFGGPNSLLKIENDKLIYDMAVEYPIGKRGLDELIVSRRPDASK